MGQMQAWISPLENAYFWNCKMHFKTQVPFQVLCFYLSRHHKTIFHFSWWKWLMCTNEYHLRPPPPKKKPLTEPKPAIKQNTPLGVLLFHPPQPRHVMDFSFHSVKRISKSSSRPLIWKSFHLKSLLFLQIAKEKYKRANKSRRNYKFLRSMGGVEKVILA